MKIALDFDPASIYTPEQLLVLESLNLTPGEIADMVLMDWPIHIHSEPADRYEAMVDHLHEMIINPEFPSETNDELETKFSDECDKLYEITEQTTQHLFKYLRTLPHDAQLGEDANLMSVFDVLPNINTMIVHTDAGS